MDIPLLNFRVITYHYCTITLVITVYGNLPVLNLSVRQWPKISIYAPAANYAFDRKMIDNLLELSRRPLSPCKVSGRSNVRAPAVRKYRVYCLSRLLCLRVGDIIWTSIVSWFWGSILMLFSAKFQPFSEALSEALKSSRSRSRR